MTGPDRELKQIWNRYNNPNTAGLLNVDALRRRYYHENLYQQQDASEFVLLLLSSANTTISPEFTFTLRISDQMLPGCTMTDLLNDNFQRQQQWETIEDSECEDCHSRFITRTVSQDFNEVIIFVLQIARGDGSKIENFNLREVVSNQVEIENKRY